MARLDGSEPILAVLALRNKNTEGAGAVCHGPFWRDCQCSAHFHHVPPAPRVTITNNAPLLCRTLSLTCVGGCALPAHSSPPHRF